MLHLYEGPDPFEEDFSLFYAPAYGLPCVVTPSALVDDICIVVSSTHTGGNGNKTSRFGMFSGVTIQSRLMIHTQTMMLYRNQGTELDIANYGDMTHCVRL